VNATGTAIETPHTHSMQRLRGIAYMIAAVAVFSIMDALMKSLTERYPPVQVASLRSLSSLVCMLIVIGARGSWRDVRMQGVKWHLLRGVLGIAMLSSFIYAVHRLTLAQTYSIYLTAPLLMTALSVPLFHEKVSPSRWLAILIGLGGVIVILKPWGKGAYTLAAAAAAMLSTVCYALSALTVRALSRTNTSLALVFWYLFIVGFSCALIAAPDWRPIVGIDWLWLAGIGITGALGQFWLTVAFSRAPPSVVGPFEYTSILWAFIIDRLFWGASPTVNLIIGAVVVIASGIFVIEEERRLAQRSATPETPRP
jgi:drug/metabolite transporter (DMT)-like permease